jgi:putative DNA primase/helicase
VYPNDHALPGQYVERHGWTDEACTHFALTDMVLGSTDLPIFSCVKGHDHREGTLSDWREVAALADGNPTMIFAMSTQFASPTIQLQTVEGNAIINLVAPSSTGKTTNLRAAASVWGRATSPDPTRPEFMTRWRNTSNALEAIAASRSGLGLVVDDLGTLSPDDAEAAAYMLGNGVGKGRLTREVQLRETKKWAFYGLSSGEVTLRDHAQQARFKRSVGAGAESRFVSVTLNEVIPELHGHASVPDFARVMCERLGPAHGTAGPAFVEWLIEHRSEVGDRLNAIGTRFLAEAQKILPARPTDQARRIVNQFAAIVAGGGLAADVFELRWRARANRETDLASDAVIEAGLTMLGLWLAENGGATLTGIDEKLDELQEKVAAQSARFPIVAKGATVFQDTDRRSILGWRDAELAGKADEVRLRFVDILPSSFREWGWDKRDEKAVMRHLRDKGMLICSKPNELKMQRKEPGVGSRVPVYRIRAAFFGEEITFKAAPC